MIKINAKISEKDKNFKAIKKEMRELKGLFVKVGVLSDSGSYGAEGGAVNLADVAAFNEFGTSRIPARPFISGTYDNKASEVEDFKRKLIGAILDGKQKARGAVEALGVWFKGEVQRYIANGDFAPNSPLTVKLKGSSKPLIDTGRLRQSINYELDKGR